MRVTSVEKLEDCFDGSSVYAFHFDQAWTRPAIRELAGFGKLEYFADFPRPFYCLRGAGGLQMKGVEGRRHCRVVVSAGRALPFRQALEERLAGVEDQAVAADDEATGLSGLECKACPIP